MTDRIRIETELGPLFVSFNDGQNVYVNFNGDVRLTYRGSTFKGYAHLQLVDGAWAGMRDEKNPEREYYHAFDIARCTGTWQTAPAAPTHKEKIKAVILAAVTEYVKANASVLIEAEKASVQRQLDRVEGEIAELDKKLKTLEIERLDLQQKLADLAVPKAKVIQLPVSAPAMTDVQRASYEASPVHELAEAHLAPAPPAPVKGLVTVDVTGDYLVDVKADIVAGKSIRIYGKYTNHVKGPQAFDRTFKLGDACERSSYNLTYTGTITAIGVKTVTVKDDTLSETSRLALQTFIWRNWDFDAAAIAKRNGEWMD